MPLLLRILRSRAARLLFLALLLLGSLHITRGSLSYLTEGDLHPFLLEKLPLPSERAWLLAIQVHVVAAAFALPACVALLSQRVLRALPQVHRWLGRMTGAVVLFALVPSGSYLAFFAMGGAPSTAGFLLSGAIVLFAMLRATQTARARDFVEHRRFTAHVVAQLSVAVTSRALLVFFHVLGVDAELAYITALWGPVIASALFVEAARIHTRSWRRSDEVARVHLLFDPVR